MNIVYLHSHDTGRYVQPYGNSVPTPNIQLLADQGVMFRNVNVTPDYGKTVGRTIIRLLYGDGQKPPASTSTVRVTSTMPRKAA